MKTAIELIADERQRQIEQEGWSLHGDDQHLAGELALAASCYAIPPGEHYCPDPPDSWPWDPSWWKPSPDDRVRELVKAGALIVAEIERLQRADQGEPQSDVAAAAGGLTQTAVEY